MKGTGRKGNRQMWECKYGREPLDTRLCLIRLIRKWWLLLLMTILGAVLFGGIYFVTHVVYGPAREYTAESEFYIEYKNAVTQEQQYTYYNKETWESLIHTDVFMDEIMAAVEAQASVDPALTKQAARESIFATLLTDVRIVHVTVTANTSEQAMLLTKALEPAFVKFGEIQREIDEIRPILIAEEAALTVVDNRTVRACILGAVVFAAFTLFFMYLYVVLDTSIYIPIEFERRFGIPMELPGEAGRDAGDSLNTMDSSEGMDSKILADSKEAVDWKEVMDSSDSTEFSDSVYTRKQKDGTYVLYVKSGGHNRTLVEKTLRDIQNKGKRASRAVLVKPDEILIKWYYKTW